MGGRYELEMGATGCSCVLMAFLLPQAGRLFQMASLENWVVCAGVSLVPLALLTAGIRLVDASEARGLLLGRILGGGGRALILIAALPGAVLISALGWLTDRFWGR